MGRMQVVTRVQICLVDLHQFDASEEELENESKLAEEIAVELNDWETVDIHAEST